MDLGFDFPEPLPICQTRKGFGMSKRAVMQKIDDQLLLCSAILGPQSVSIASCSCLWLRQMAIR
jgi:hypothetical protein